MPKRTSVAGRRRIQDRLDANRSEGERLLNNKELMAEVKRLQRQYGLPFRSETESKRYWEVLVKDWRWEAETQRAVFGPTFERHSKLIEQLNILRDRHALPDRLHDALWGLVFEGRPGVQNGGGAFPGLPFPKYGMGEKPYLLVSPNTDIDNPIVLQLIRNWQAFWREQPPSPLTMADSRQKDWRPVWEWHKRHPQVSMRELANKIGYSHGTVRNQLSLLDEELSSRTK